MLLLDDYGFLISPDIVEKLKQTKEGRDKLDDLFYSNRAYDACERVSELIQTMFLPNTELDNDVKGEIFSLIYDAFSASEEEQDEFVIKKAECGNNYC